MTYNVFSGTLNLAVSNLGPTLYIIMEGDLKALSNTNLLFKYADNTNLLVPEITDVH